MSARSTTADHAAALLAPAVAAGTEADAIDRVAVRLADRVRAGGRVYAFGAGHSYAVAAELCSRAGGLRAVTSMNLDDLRETPRHAHEQLADSMPERVPANGPALLRAYAVGAADALLVVSQSGRNGASVEMARAARGAGTYVAAILSTRHCAAFPSRHPDGLKLPDVVDDVLDNHGPVGDAALTTPGGARVSATSTVSGALLAQLLNAALAVELERRGLDPVVIDSANVDPVDRPR